MKKFLKVLISLVTVFLIAPLCVNTGYALEFSEAATHTQVSDESDAIKPEVVYQDANGNEFTKPITGIQTCELTAGWVVVGIQWKYTTKSSGTQLYNMLRKVAGYAFGTMAASSVIAMFATLAATPISLATAVLGAMGAAVGKWLNSQCNSLANKVQKHLNSGKATMYLDRTAWSAL